MEKNYKTVSLADGIPYSEIYSAIAGLYGSIKVSENEPLYWDKAELVRFFKRVGGVPQSHNRRRASLRVLLAAERMAQSGGAPVSEVYQLLCTFTASEDCGLCLQRPQCPLCPIAHMCRHASRKITSEDLPPGERPRERLLENGPENLTDSELLAILIAGGGGGESATELAKRLMATYGTLQRLEQAGGSKLSGIKGIGKSKAARITAAFELGVRSLARPIGSGTPVKGSRQAFEHYRHKFFNLKKEVFFSILLDTRHRVICEEKVAIGSLNESIVHPREVFKRAVAESAHAVLFAHNHPSGDPGPSPQDHRLTARLVKAGDLMGIKVLDHIIVGKESYYSFAENGNMA